MYKETLKKSGFNDNTIHSSLIERDNAERNKIGKGNPSYSTIFYERGNQYW